MARPRWQHPSFVDMTGRRVGRLTVERRAQNQANPFVGSGTTLVVAHRLGRESVGIDQSEVAIRYATERVRVATAQKRLFEGVQANG